MSMMEFSHLICHIKERYIDGLVQDCSISIALAMLILQPCTKPSICDYVLSFSMKVGNYTKSENECRNTKDE